MAHDDLRAMVSVGLETRPPGREDLRGRPAHLLRIHAGAPANGACPKRRFRLVRGDIDLLPAGMSAVTTFEQPATTLVIGFAPLLVRRAAAELGRDPDRIALAPQFQLRDPQIEHVAWALAAEHRAGYPGGRWFAESLGAALMVRLIGGYAAPEVPSGLSRRELAAVEDYVEAHLDESLSLSRLAGFVGISPSHLKALFKRTTGLTVHAYVVRRRVERARELLVAGRLSASEIALAAGFAHQSHMARWMRRLLGVVPSHLARRES